MYHHILEDVTADLPDGLSLTRRLKIGFLDLRFARGSLQRP